jgi:hypothetical protein
MEIKLVSQPVSGPVAYVLEGFGKRVDYLLLASNQRIDHILPHQIPKVGVNSNSVASNMYFEQDLHRLVRE